MNKWLQDFARQKLKEWLLSLPEESHRIFKLMYSHKHMDRTIEQAVDAMPADKLDWAMQQVDNTIQKREKAATEAAEEQQ